MSRSRDHKDPEAHDLYLVSRTYVDGRTGESTTSTKYIDIGQEVSYQCYVDITI